MDAGQVAFTSTGCREPCRAANCQELAVEPLVVEQSQQIIEADTMAADHNQIGGVQTFAEELDLDDVAGFQVFTLPGNDNEAISPAESSD